MNINELIIKEEKELTDKQREFLDVHNNILSSGSVVANGMISLAQNLKRMRDEKLYVEAGYQSFEDYSVNACGLKQRQAYNYIKVLDDFGEEFLHSNAKIGVSKLALLSTLSDDQRVEVLENVSVEDISVAEFKKQISDLKLENKQLSDKVERLKNQPEKIVTKVEKDEEAKKQVEDLKQKLKEESGKLKSALAQIKESSSKIAELKKSGEINSDVLLVEFKIKFNNLQIQIKDINLLLEKMSEEKKDSCKNALKKVLEVLC